MKISYNSFLIVLAVLTASVLQGCNDQVVPDQRIVDQMNAQRSKQAAAQKSGAPPTGGSNPYTTGSSTAGASH
jgi:hypothetical protein